MSDDFKPKAFYAPVVQPDGSLMETQFATYEAALDQCRKTEAAIEAKWKIVDPRTGRAP